MEERIVTAAQMRAAEETAKRSGLNEDILIENAAAAVFALVKPSLKKSDVIAVFVGGGNNAADGLSLARMLFLSGVKTEVVTTTERCNDNAAARLKAFKALGGRAFTLDEASGRSDGYTVIFDAVFGIGLSREVGGDFKRAVDMMNESGAEKIALDIPSGLCADCGAVLGTAVKTDITVTFGAYKYGHFLGRGADVCGRILLADVGIRTDSGALLCGKNAPALKPRNKVGHKGDYGRVRIIGGSGNMIGAPLLSAESALRCGAGLVTLCVAESLADAYRSRVKEATLMLLPDTRGYIRFDESALDKAMKGADVVCIGMGMGSNPDLPSMIEYLADNFDGTLIVDADGLGALAGRTGRLKGHRCKLVLTPHRGEFARLFGETDEREAVEKTEKKAEELNAVIVNKSNVTLITDGKTTYINAVPCPALAKGGSGDTLVGAAAALSVRLGALKGAARACYECSFAALEATKALGENAVLASDVIERLTLRR